MRSFAAHRNIRVPQGTARASIQALLREQEVDAVLAEFGTIALRIAPVFAEIGLPVFSYFLGADASAHLRQPFRAEAYRCLMPNLSGVFAVSQFLLDNLARHGIHHPKSYVMPSGVDTSLFMRGEKRKGSFFSVGRFIDKKRPDITIRAFAQVARIRSETRLEMVGNGPLLEKCRALAAAEGVANQVVFHGHKPREFVRERLKSCEVFLQHSVTAPNGDTEGLPTAIQEAMAAGMPVISTRHAGIPEAVLEGKTGFLVEEGDEKGFADKIGYVLESLDVETMGARARKLAVERFDNRFLTRKVEEHIIALSKL